MGSVRWATTGESLLAASLDRDEGVFELARRMVTLETEPDEAERAASSEYAFVEFRLRYVRREATTSLEAASVTQLPRTVYDVVINTFTHYLSHATP